MSGRVSRKQPDEVGVQPLLSDTSPTFYRIHSPTPSMVLARIVMVPFYICCERTNLTENKSSLRKGKCFSYSRCKSCRIQRRSSFCRDLPRFHVFCGLAPELQFLAGISHESRTAPNGDSHNVIFQIRPGRSHSSIYPHRRRGSCGLLHHRQLLQRNRP